MNRTLLTSAVLLAGTLSAGAADLAQPSAPPVYVPPAFTWSGSYIGINGGFVSLEQDLRPICLGPSNSGFDPGCVILPRRDRRESAFIGGITSGYNYQVSPGWGLVVGYESDTNLTGLRRRDTVVGPFQFIGGGTTGPGAYFTTEQRIDHLSTARARVGLAFNRFLIYGTGGLAYGRVRLLTAAAFPDGTLFGQRDSGVRAGWVAGGGIEYAFWGNLSAKVEGLVYDIGRRTILGSETRRFTQASNQFQYGAKFETKGAIVRAGLNYKFAWDPITPLLSGGR